MGLVGAGLATVAARWFLRMSSNLERPDVRLSASESSKDGRGYRKRAFALTLRHLSMGCLLPGFFGSLVLSLALLSIFQLPVVRTLYGTIVPWAWSAALVLFLLPRAVLLELLLRSIEPQSALHAAELARSSTSAAVRAAAGEIVWRLRGRGRFWCLGLLVYWGYLDLLIAHLLAPIGLASAPTRLYIQMHYGRNSVLSAMTCLAIAAPVLLFISCAAARRLWFRVIPASLRPFATERAGNVA
jgi:hypothetical protein